MKILRMSTLTKAIYRFNVFNIKIPMKLFFFFCRNRKTHPKIYTESQWISNSQNWKYWKRKNKFLRFQYWNKNKAEGITLPDFKTHYKSVILKRVWSWHKDQLITKETSQIKSHTYWSMVFEKMPRLFNGEKAVPSTNVRENWISTRTRIKLTRYLTIDTKF